VTLINGEAPESSTVGLVLSVVSLAIMPTLASRPAWWRPRNVS
jgi:hypothetical protein